MAIENMGQTRALSVLYNASGAVSLRKKVVEMRVVRVDKRNSMAFADTKVSCDITLVRARLRGHGEYEQEFT